jgi:DnaJ-class molecular chaperone
MGAKMTKMKQCPNCHGEGTENNPPLRRCGICKGSGRLPEAPRINRRREVPSSANSASRGAECQAGQGAS